MYSLTNFITTAGDFSTQQAALIMTASSSTAENPQHLSFVDEQLSGIALTFVEFQGDSPK